MSDSRSIFGILIFAGILLFAAWLGVSIVTDQIQTIAYVFAGVTLITCVLLGRRIWMIIPFAMALNITLMIPGQPSTLILAQALFCGFSILLFMMRRLPYKIRFSELDFWMLMLTICVAQAYFRNPVGLNIFGGDSVGARPYAVFVATIITSLFLSYYRIPPDDLKWLLRLHIIGGLLNFAILTVGYLIPRVGVWYGAVAASNSIGQLRDEDSYGIERATRIGFVGEIARNISLWVSAFKSPLKACLHPIWGTLILMSLAFAALSGFRNEIIAVGLTYLVALTYRGGIKSLIIATCILALGISFLAMINIAAPLPSNIQRSLTFLPGTWDEYHKKDAEESTQWRIDMWEEALLTDYWIENKILGDGLGMTREELNYVKSFGDGFAEAQSTTRTGKLTLQQEFMMASNDYHSGPVSTIRTIGYLGLSILIIAQIRLAVHAHRQIKRARNTEWMPITLLIGIPIIWTPVFFVFVYGAFGNAISSFLLGVALIRILENNLPLEDPSKIIKKDFQENY